MRLRARQSRLVPRARFTGRNAPFRRVWGSRGGDGHSHTGGREDRLSTGLPPGPGRTPGPGDLRSQAVKGGKSC